LAGAAILEFLLLYRACCLTCCSRCSSPTVSFLNARQRKPPSSCRQRSPKKATLPHLSWSSFLSSDAERWLLVQALRESCFFLTHCSLPPLYLVAYDVVLGRSQVPTARFCERLSPALVAGPFYLSPCCVREMGFQEPFRSSFAAFFFVCVDIGVHPPPL